MTALTEVDGRAVNRMLRISITAIVDCRVWFIMAFTSVSEKRGISQTHRLSGRMLWMPVRQPANSSAIGNTS